MQLTFKDYISLFEVRKDNIEYVEVKVKDKIARVVTTLEGNQSGVITKLAKTYMQLDRAVKALAERRNANNEELTDTVSSFFDEATDSVYTRVINTVSFTLTLAKQTPPEDKTTVDYEKICAELKKLISEDLIGKIAEIEKQYTTVIPKETQKLKKPGLKVDVVKEGFIGDLNQKFKAVLTIFLAKIKAWGKDYDKKLSALEKQLT